MALIILDFGSANTCSNDKQYVQRMLDELHSIDNHKHEIIIKWQLFERAGDNIPLQHEVFDYAYKYAKSLGYKTTSSVFDYSSLSYLLNYDIPFIKIANSVNYEWIIGEVPRKIPIIISAGDSNRYNELKHKLSRIDTILSCVSQYPSTIDMYNRIFDYYQLRNISDHTTDFQLFNMHKPGIIEWHYGLSDSTGLDAGLFMKTPEQLKSIL